MEEQIAKYDELKSNVAHWQEQKYYDDNARQEAMMNGNRPNEKCSEMILSNLRKAEGKLTTFELWNYEVVEAWEEKQAAEEKEELELARKAVWNA